MKKFKSYREVMNDPKCAFYITEEIQRMWETQNKILETMPEGARLRRTPFLTLGIRELLNPEGMRLEMERIDKKECKLSAGERWLIREIIWNSVAETINYYKK